MITMQIDGEKGTLIIGEPELNLLTSEKYAYIKALAENLKRRKNNVWKIY